MEWHGLTVADLPHLNVKVEHGGRYEGDNASLKVFVRKPEEQDEFVARVRKIIEYQHTREEAAREYARAADRQRKEKLRNPELPRSKKERRAVYEVLKGEFGE
jgi:hypothetical protein